MKAENMNKERKGTGSITISRVSGDGERVEIGITDGDSHVCFVEAHLTLEQFARAVTGMSVSDIVIQTRGLDLVGTRRLVRRESVEVPNGLRASTEQAMKACDHVAARLEIETGLEWSPNYDDARRRRHLNKDGTYTVSFVTFEDFEKKEERGSDEDE